MKLIVTEKNLAAEKIAGILADGKPSKEKVYNTPVYRFTRGGEEWVAIGLKGHILGVDFPAALRFGDGAWHALWKDDRETAVVMPEALGVPGEPGWSKRKPFSADGVDLSQWRLQSLRYLVWAPIGKTPAEKEIVRSLKTLAKKADNVVIATDYDREGELIGADARSMVREVNATVPVFRARFSAFTKSEIETAFAGLGEVEDALAFAAEARQDIDLVWGAVLTRYLTKVKFQGIGQPRSVGRVQTPTLKLIVDREKERLAFEPETYWTVKAKASFEGEEFPVTHRVERFKVEEQAAAVMKAVEGATSGTVTSLTKVKRTSKPPTPFNTTALQAAAASEGLSPARTMRLAETLYMDGLISYPRVDNTVYPESLDLHLILTTLAAVSDYAPFAKKLLAQGHLSATRGKKETTDHPPIHPTGAAGPSLKADERKLYDLICRRFMATLASDAVIEGTKAEIDVAGETFVSKGDVLVVPGYREIYRFGLKKDEQLPAICEGCDVGFLGALMEEKQTKPPARYSQGKLIEEMESRGLGTKATRHDIIQRLYDRRYIINDPAEPTCLGMTVVDALTRFAERITLPEMTAELEAEMDEIAHGRNQKSTVVDHSRQVLADVMDSLLEHAEEVGELIKAAADEDAKVGLCTTCGRDLLVRQGKNGQFVGCSGYPDCSVTYPLPQGRIEPVEAPCAECGTPQILVKAFKSKPRTICLDPLCATNVEPELDLGTCPTCRTKGVEGRIISRKNPKTLKRYARCTNYEECETSYPLPQRGTIETTAESCEPCGAPIVVIHTDGKTPWRICVSPECPGKADASGNKKPRKPRAPRKS